MAELFPPASGPRVFALPPGADFASALLDGLAARAAHLPPQHIAATEIYVNTNRAARRLQAVLESRPVALPPRIRVLTDLPGQTPGLPPALPPLRRRLELAQLIRKLIAQAPDMAARASAYPLADSLAALLGEMQIEGVDFDALHGLDTGDASGHWARALAFLDLIRPYVVASGTSADPDARLALAMARTTAGWALSPPAHPVIVAGSTGARGATARFMAAVAVLPQGAVVLPGLDFDLPPELWERLAQDPPLADHPQFGLARFCARLGLPPEALQLWHSGGPPVPERAALISLALRPAPVTDQWLRDGPALVPTLGTATDGLTLIEAATPGEEATAIALTLRHAVAEGQSAALITPDRVLARQVTSALDRWRIAPDDSAGRPLDLTPPGVFLRLCAGLLTNPAEPVPLVALLKHPMAASTPGSRTAHLRILAEFEAALRRNPVPQVDGALLARWSASDKAPTGAADWAEWLGPALAPPATGTAPLADLVARCLTLAETLAAGPGQTGSGILWEEEAGIRAQTLTQTLTEHAGAGGALPVSEFPVLLRAILSGQNSPDAAYTPHPQVAIWGTLEARTQTADVIVLGGLNEGVWPRLPRPDPWLSRTMRGAAGLPLPERQIGLSAHDFQQAAGNARVVLTRATRDAEAPTVPARWLLRLTNLMTGLGPEGEGALDAMRARGNAQLALCRQLDRLPDSTDPALGTAPRPAPLPPPELFPARLPFTQIETLMRDPYAVYARYILRLRALDPLARVPDYMARGTVSHAALERFVRETRTGLPPDAEPLFRKAVVEEIAKAVPWPAARAIWTARLLSITDWFLDTEAARRKIARPALLEKPGEMPVPGLTRPFALYGRADRIDADGQGGVAIYDYKGGLPGVEEAKLFHKQLPLEACTALAGGFDGIAATDVLSLALIGLSKPEIRTLDCDTETLARTLGELSSLIAAYQSGTVPFRARARVKKREDTGDYDHLARFGEWLDGANATPEALS